MVKDDKGYIVVETTGTFILFVLLVTSILSLVNIVTLQARVHYALTQTANTISMYSHILDAIGVDESLSALDNNADRFLKKANATRNGIEAVLSGILSFPKTGSIPSGEEINQVFGWLEEAAGDPAGTLRMLMDYGGSMLQSKFVEELVRPLVGRHLANGDLTGDEYLRSVRVVNGEKTGLAALEFYERDIFGMQNSVLIDRNGNVKLVVHYEVQYSFGALPLPFNPTLKITQTVITKAWLSGSGKGYWR